jgi:hypothetical protein
MKETSNRSHFTPEGWHTVTARIVAHDAEQLVKFVRQVFGATGDYRPDLPSVIRIRSIQADQGSAHQRDQT